jgi:hypothetical protein
MKMRYLNTWNRFLMIMTPLIYQCCRVQKRSRENGGYIIDLDIWIVNIMQEML